MSFGIGHDETIVFAAGILEETIHTLAEPVPGIPLLLCALVALNVVLALIDPWRKAILRRVPGWCIAAYCVMSGLALNWYWAYSWFSPRCAFSSGPVVRRMASFVALNALIGFLAGRLFGGRWLITLAYFALASCVLTRLFHL